MPSLEGRHALITGASRGIGAATAAALARAGVAVSLVARSMPATEGLPGRSFTAVADVTDETALAAAIDAARDALGPIDILVNNAGGAETAPFARADLALVRRMLELNLVSAFAATRMVLPEMTARGFGRIVNIASTAGLKGYPYVSAYVAAKHGLVGLTKSLAIEMAATGVTVNAICPGYTDTALVADAVSRIAGRTGQSEADVRASFTRSNPTGRLVRPEEVAAAVQYLCGEDAAAVNGAVLAIAGGEVS